MIAVRGALAKRGFPEIPNIVPDYSPLFPAKVFVPYTKVFIDIIVASMKEGEGIFISRSMDANTFGSTAEHAPSGNMPTGVQL